MERRHQHVLGVGRHLDRLADDAASGLAHRLALDLAVEHDRHDEDQQHPIDQRDIDLPGGGRVRAAPHRRPRAWPNLRLVPIDPDELLGERALNAAVQSLAERNAHHLAEMTEPDHLPVDGGRTV